MNMGMNSDKRDIRNEIRLNGVELMKGDASSISVIFGNLDGRNFETRGIKDQTHSEWLAYMASELKTPLDHGTHIEMLSPDGSKLQESTIGQSLEMDESRNTERAHKIETQAQRETISRILRDLANERWPIDESQPQDQTQAWAGECSLFVDAAWRPLQQAGVTFDDEGMIGKFGHLGCAVKPPPGLSMEEVSQLGIEEHINHHWLVSDGLHFDASCPDGVDSVFDLRGIRQTAAGILERDHPKILHKLCTEHEWWRDSVLMLIDFRKQRAAVETPKPKNVRRSRP